MQSSHSTAELEAVSIFIISLFNSETANYLIVSLVFIILSQKRVQKSHVYKDIIKVCPTEPAAKQPMDTEISQLGMRGYGRFKTGLS